VGNGVSADPEHSTFNFEMFYARMDGSGGSPDRDWIGEPYMIAGGTRDVPSFIGTLIILARIKNKQGTRTTIED